MAGKKPTEKIETETDNSKIVEPVLLTIKRSHCIEPHSIELRRDEEGFVIDARTEDPKHIETIGAKTVAEILAENGAAIPDTEEQDLQIKFSPHNGAIISIEPKPAEETEKPA